MGATPDGISLMIWMIVFTCLTTIVVGLRIWSAHLTGKGLQIHDYLVIVAYLSVAAQAGVGWWAIANGLGGHTKDRTQKEIGVQWQLLITACVTWLVSTVACKLSILTLYLSLFRTSRSLRMVALIACSIVGAYFVAFLPVFLTQCHPLSYGWKPVPGGWCKSLAPSEIASISLNIFIDTAIAVMPVPVLWRLHMALCNKITIAAMFLMGLIVVAVMIWRLQITLDPANQLDFVHGLGSIALTSFLEVWLSIIIISLPTLAPLFRRYIEPFLRSRRSTGGRAHLREAKHTIGSTPRKQRGKDVLDSTQDSTVELKNRGYSANIETSPSRWPDDAMGLVQNMQPNSIQIRHDVSVRQGSDRGSESV
ncbi:hypothetical protein BDV25DRAFT_97553 [Aspergillus avenaceus]|uniref:Rhodopsin domain-containing protein n=1 Tax=Aspergillus avenaceus TaxID=36643 RepID=A0A5N6TXY0_ASPAV|nr:hypothetical protein BDV25DRAFT_97553 [Aspergillus avenaceus]